MSTRRTTHPLPGEESGEGDFLPTECVDSLVYGFHAEAILTGVARFPEHVRRKPGIQKLARVASLIQAAIANKDRRISEDLPRLRALLADARTLAGREGFADSYLNDGWPEDE